MANPESQGKTVALVIFVVLFVGTACSTYYFFDKVDTAEKTAAKSREDKQKAEKDTADTKKQYAELREMIGALKAPAGGGDDHKAFVESHSEQLNLKTVDIGDDRRKELAGQFPNYENAIAWLAARLKGADSKISELTRTRSSATT